MLDVPGMTRRTLAQAMNATLEKDWPTQARFVRYIERKQCASTACDLCWCPSHTSLLFHSLCQGRPDPPVLLCRLNHCCHQGSGNAPQLPTLTPIPGRPAWDSNPGPGWLALRTRPAAPRAASMFAQSGIIGTAANRASAVGGEAVFAQRLGILRLPRLDVGSVFSLAVRVQGQIVSRGQFIPLPAVQPCL